MFSKSYAGGHRHRQMQKQTSWQVLLSDTALLDTPGVMSKFLTGHLSSTVHRPILVTCIVRIDTVMLLDFDDNDLYIRHKDKLVKYFESSCPSVKIFWEFIVCDVSSKSNHEMLNRTEEENFIDFHWWKVCMQLCDGAFCQNWVNSLILIKHFNDCWLTGTDLSSGDQFGANIQSWQPKVESRMFHKMLNPTKTTDMERQQHQLIFPSMIRQIFQPFS